MQYQNSAGTTLMPDGKRVNWWNVSFFTYEEKNDEIIVEFKWKYKASIRAEKVTVGNLSNMRDYFRKWNLVPIGKNTYVNLSKILMIEEIDHRRGPIDYTLLRFIFTDGFQENILIKSDSWNWWRSNLA